MEKEKKITKVLGILKKINYHHYCLGIYDSGLFYDIPGYLKCNCIKIQVKKDYESKILNKLIGIKIFEMHRSKYETIYKLEDHDFLFMEYVVDSHVIIPKTILKDFCSLDKKLYYIDTKSRKIQSKSASKYNTKFGYYSLRFEEFLSNEYENNIGRTKEKICNIFFRNVCKENQNISVRDIQKFLDSSLIRNPQFVLNVNQKSLSSKLLYKGYDTEFLMKLQNKHINNLFKDYEIYILINRTEKGFVLSSSIFSNIFLKNDVGGIIVPLHPKFGIIIIPPNNSFPYSNDYYMVIDNIDDLIKINKRIFSECIKDKSDIIGIKEDLILLLKD